MAKSRKRGINIAYSVQYFKQLDIRIRTVTDFICIPRLNEAETRCTLVVYSNPSMQLQRIFRFKTAEIFPLYDTNEEVAQLDFGLD